MSGPSRAVTGAPGPEDREEPGLRQLRVRDRLAAQVRDGALDGQTRLPTERALAERLQCNRVTLREALQQLEAEGLLYRENRRGWFVSPPRVRYNPTQQSRFTDFVIAQGRRPLTECLRAETRPAGPRYAGLLQLTETALIHWIQRRRWIDQRPVLVEEIAIDADWCPGLLECDLDGSLVAILAERFNLRHSRSQIELCPATLTAEHAELLRVNPGSSSLRIERLNFFGERPVEYDCEFWRHDALTVELDISY